MTVRLPPSEGELEILKVLWDEGPATVREVDEALRGRGKPRAYTTLQTLLSRLQSKGHVASSPRGPALAYRAESTRDDLLRDRLRDLADELCEGQPTPLILTLVESHRFSAEEVERFRTLLNRHRPAATDPRPESPRKPHQGD